MKCPECNKELEEVSVYSQCYQRGFLTGNKITEYDDTEVLETLAIECPYCSAEITNSIED